MTNFLDTVQKKIGLLLSIIGIAVVITNFIYRLQRGDILYALGGVSVWSASLYTTPFIISIFIEGRVLKYLQILMFMVAGTLNIIDSFQQFYGPGLFLAAWLLMRHYGFLEKHATAKNTALLILVTGLSQLSAYIHTGGRIYAGLTTLLYTLFLVLLLVIIWRDMVKQQQELKKENRSLKMDYSKLARQLEELEKDQKPFDLKAVRISPAETRVIEPLTVYKASNREIAERLNLAESTVKLHLYNIYNKIGVDNRFAIMDLCKYNFGNNT
jgi:DNA-binding CsgD family transcriptional regulator